MTTLAIILGIWLLVSVIAGLLIGRGIHVLSSDERRNRHPARERPAVRPSAARQLPIGLKRAP